MEVKKTTVPLDITVSINRFSSSLNDKAPCF